MFKVSNGMEGERTEKMAPIFDKEAFLDDLNIESNGLELVSLLIESQVTWFIQHPPLYFDSNAHKLHAFVPVT